MTKRQTKYIVKRNYDDRRTDTDAFLRLKDDNTNKDDNNVVEIEHKDSNPIIWAVVPIVGVAIISGIILIIKRKR